MTESDHLAECAVCRRDLDAFREVADLGAESQEARDLPAPPDRVWRAIESEVARTRSTETPVTDLAERRAHRKRPRRWVPLAAAAAAVVLAIAGTVTVDRLLERRETESVTARATLSPLPSVSADARGSVRVLADGQVEVDVRNLPLTTGFHEVWLLDPDDPTKMVALGNLPDQSRVVLPVPPGTDLNRFRLVDVCDEPHDGDATHSGNSLLRGTLTS
ncbi:anti-sigma factor [Actinoplanes philippinensis]|uniref:anti-sigma factor n=1 Tax=Actinoplanes philippinensis TaxID=35752 RepID=UPI0033D79AB2